MPTRGECRLPGRAPAQPPARHTVPTRLTSKAAAYKAPKVPQKHCADAGGRPAALRDKSLRSETAPEILDAARSATPPKTSGAKESSRGPAGAAPSACPNLPIRLCLRRAARLAGCSRRRSRREPSVPSRRASASIPALEQSPAATPCRSRRAVEATAKFGALPSAWLFHSLDCPARNRELTASSPRRNRQ